MGGLETSTQTVFFFGFFFCLWGLVLADRSPPLPYSGRPFHLVAAIIIAPKGAELPGSHCMALGALVYFLPSETVRVRGGGGL